MMRTRLIHGRDSREGAILAAVLIMLLVLSFAWIVFMELGTSNAIGTVRQGQISQAFWSAEAGLHHMKAQLRNEVLRGNTPCALSTNWAGMSYSVMAVSNGPCLYTITSTGVVGQAMEVVRQTVVFSNGPPGAFGYGIFAGGLEFDINGNNTVSGNVYAVDTSNTGDLYMVSGIIQDTNSLPMGPELVPQLVTSNYDALIAVAATAGAVVKNGTISSNIALNGVTKYYKGNVELASDQISGSGGTIVISGNFNFKGSGSTPVSVTNNVRIIVGGTLSAAQGFSAGTNCVLYSGSTDTTHAITFNQNATIGVPIGGCSMITPGGIYVNKTLTFYGMIFAGGDVYIKENATVSGSLVALGDLTVQNNSGNSYGLRLSYDSSMIPYDITALGFIPVLFVYNVYWQQVL